MRDGSLEDGISAEESNKRRKLPHGEAMTCSEANIVTRARETSFVLVAGSPESGKTTLLASLIHCFQRGQIGELHFAGSNTLVGFDQRCHSGRTRSRLLAPNTPRTNSDEPKRILHLRVADEQSQQSDILFTDISGEEYDYLRHSVDACREFQLLSRADHLVLLIDGERLSNTGERHAARIEALQMLRCLQDAGHLNSQSWLDVLIAKSDLMTAEDGGSFADALLSEIASKYSKKIAQLRHEYIAARPDKESEEFPLGYGISKLLPAWRERRVESVELRTRPQSEISMCEFDKFLRRNSPNLFEE